jgi:ribosomal small subunit protein bTHX
VASSGCISGPDRRGRSFDVLPRGGTLVVFLSDRFPHEVLPARPRRVVPPAVARRLECGARISTGDHMGKGDIRTRRGKLFAGSHGKTRSRRTNKSAATAKKNRKKR